MADLYANITAERSEPGKTAGQTINTILLTDGDLVGMNTPWPLSHTQQASVMRVIGAAAPKAVLVDFFFVDVRDPEESRRLVDELERLACRTQLYMISPPDQAIRNNKSIWTDFYERHRSGRSANYCPIFLVDAIQPAAMTGRFYPQFTTGRLPSPAQGIFESIESNQTVETGIAALDHSSFEVEWTIPSRAGCDRQGISAIIDKGGDQDCPSIWRNALLRLLGQLLSGIGVDLTRQGIPDLYITGVTPTPTFAISELSSRGSPAFKALKGSIVFYGASVSGSDDTVQTPLYRAVYRDGVPGVYWHASALQTLIDNAGQPKRALRGQAERYSLTIIVLAFSAVAFLIFGICFSSALSLSMLAALTSITTFLICAALGHRLNVSSTDWIDIPFLFAAGIAAAEPILKKFRNRRLR